MCQPSALYIRITIANKTNEGIVVHYCTNFELTGDEIFPILIFYFITEAYIFNDQRLELSSVWALLAAFEDPLPIPYNDSHGAFEGAFVRDVDSLSWMGNNTRKLFPLQTGKPECWTFFSTAAYGKRNKVPQVACLLKSTSRMILLHNPIL